MNYPVILLLAAGLSMDALAVSIACGAQITDKRLFHASRIAFLFGFFQALMPLLGVFAGIKAKSYISDYDHWVAFAILLAIGVKMIYEAAFIEKEEGKAKDGMLGLRTLLILAVATSIDALAVGFTLPILTSRIFYAASLIGISTFIICFCGVFVGEKIGHFFEGKIEIAGGAVLIAIGVKILLDHTLWT